ESSAHAFCKRPDPPCNQRAVAHAAETAELFNVEMDDLAWFLALVAWMWFLQLEAREPAEAAAFENARDAGFGDVDLGCAAASGERRAGSPSATCDMISTSSGTRNPATRSPL